MSKLNTKLKILSLVVFGISMLTSNASADIQKGHYIDIKEIILEDNTTKEKFIITGNTGGKIEIQHGEMAESAAKFLADAYKDHTVSSADKFDADAVSKYVRDCSKITDKPTAQKEIASQFKLIGFDVSDIDEFKNVTISNLGSAKAEKDVNSCYAAIEKVWANKAAESKDELKSTEDLSTKVTSGTFESIADLDTGHVSRYNTAIGSAEFKDIKSAAIIKYLKIEFTDTPEKRAEKLMKELASLDTSSSFTYSGNGKSELIDAIRALIKADYKADNKTLVNDANKLIASIFCQVIHANVKTLKNPSDAATLFLSLGIKDEIKAKSTKATHHSDMATLVAEKLVFEVDGTTAGSFKLKLKDTSKMSGTDCSTFSSDGEKMMNAVNILLAGKTYDESTADSSTTATKDIKTNGSTITFDFSTAPTYVKDAWKKACKKTIKTKADNVNSKVFTVITEFLKDNYNIDIK